MNHGSEFEPLWQSQLTAAALSAQAKDTERQSFDISEAYARGYEDGSRDAAQAAKVVEQRLLERQREELARLTTELQEGLTVSISDQLTAQLTAIEASFKRTLLTLLGAAVIDRIEHRELQKLQELVGRATDFKVNTKIFISGPSEIAQKCQEAFNEAGYAAIVTEAHADELTVTIGETELRSAFPKVLAELKDILDER